MQGSSYAEESPESLWKRNLQVTALSHAGDDEVVMSFVFRNGQIAAVASASGEEEIKQQEKQKTNVKPFISAVKKYTDMQQLDAAMLREFIDRIEVSHTDKKSKTREITIVYNFIGAFDFERAKEKAQNTTEKQQRTA